MENHVKFFSGSMIEVMAIQRILDHNKIDYIIRDDIQSGVIAGFGTIDKSVNILVSEEDFQKAKLAVEHKSHNSEDI